MLTVQWRRRDSAGKLAYAVWVFAPWRSASAVASSAMGKATEGLWNRWMDEESRFFASDRTRERANLTVPGS